MIEKLPIVPARLRRIPPGFGWVDHRFVRDGSVSQCSTDALALFLVLVTVSDQEGLSYFGDALLCAHLGWSKSRLEAARGNLEEADLVAYSTPLYQVLELKAKNGEAS